MNTLFRILPLLATGLAVVGCQDYDGGFNASEIKKADFANNFEKAFGKVDPNGTWNATRGGSVTVSVDELSQVMVYAKGLSVNLQLRCDVLEAGETKTIVYDAPKGVEEVYVIAKNKNGWTSETVKVGEDKSVSLNLAKTRALPATYNYGNAHLIKHAYYCYTIDKNENITSTLNAGIEDWYSYEGYNMDFKLAHAPYYTYPTWGTLYAAYPWPATSGNVEGDKNRNDLISAASVDVPKNTSTITEAFQAAIVNVVGTADDKQSVLEPYTQDIKYMTTVEPGEVELTFVSKQTNSNNAIGYYYTFGEQTTAELKAVKKFVLIPNLNNCSAGDKYKLVYFGKNYDEEGSYNFPKNCTIHFFLSRAADGNPSAFNMPATKIATSFPKDEAESAEKGYNVYKPIYTDYTDIYGLNCQYMYFSDAELNDVVRNANFSTFTFPATAAFNVMGQNCISFEDWPSNGSIDWNDAIFTVEAPFQDFSSFDEVQSFVIAVEDLGNTHDFDYNDCVVRVQQSTTTLKYSNGTFDTSVNPATVTLLASGGTLPIAVTYDETTLIPETHAAFGVESTIPVNVGSTTKAPVTVTWTNAPENLSMAVDAPKFKFIVTNDGGETTTVNVPTATKGTNNAPVAFVIPDAQSWTWPGEGVNITSVYSDFATWVANNNDASANYWYNFQWGKTYTSGGGETGSGETGGGETGFTPITETYTSFTASSPIDITSCFEKGATSATIKCIWNNDAGYVWIEPISIYAGSEWQLNIEGFNSDKTEKEIELTEAQLSACINAEKVEMRIGSSIVGLEKIIVNVE